MSKGARWFYDSTLREQIPVLPLRGVYGAGEEGRAPGLGGWGWDSFLVGFWGWDSFAHFRVDGPKSTQASCLPLNVSLKVQELRK